MLINLSELFNLDGKEKTYTLDIEMNEFHVSGQVYQVTNKKPVQIQIVNTGNRILELTGRTELSLMIPCARCLTPVKNDFILDLEQILDMKLSEEDRVKVLDEKPFIKGYNLDVDQLVCDELLLNLPMKVLCSDDCKGICNRCGANLNYEDCQCDRSSLDPRMSVIQDIFKQFKEV